MAARRSSAKTARPHKKTAAEGKATARGKKKTKAKSQPVKVTKKKAGKKKATSSKSAGKKSTKATSKAGKNGRRTSAGKSPARQAKSADASGSTKARKRGAKAAKTAGKTPAHKKKKAAKAGRAPGKKKSADRGTSKLQSLDREAVNELEAAGVIERLQVLTHVDDDSSNEVPLLIERLDDVASETDLPAMFGALTGDDTLGIQWSIFFILERFDDHYLEALLEALPGLHERAPEWAHTAVIRILNTRDDQDDCTQAFEDLAAAATDDQRECLVQVLHELAADPTGDLTPPQRESIALTLQALGEEQPDPDPLHLAGAREG